MKPPNGLYGRWVAIVLLVAVAYALTGKLSLLLAIPPGYATAIFPPAGIALVALSLGGMRLWPGVLLGSFGMNVWVTYTQLHRVDAQGVLIAAFIASGATLQALVGALLVRRFVSAPLALESERDIFRFTLLGGPLSCLCSASVGVTTLFLAGAISPAEYPYSWWTWWVGDSIGVLIAAPLAMVVVGRPRALWWSRKASVAIPLVAAVAVVVAVFVRVSDRENERIAQQFAQRAQTLQTEIQSLMLRCADTLAFLERFHAVVPLGSRDRFEAFVRPAFSQCPALRAVSWNPVVRGEDRLAFENGMWAEGYPAYLIRELSPSGQLIPAAVRPQYVPVAYVVPYAGNERAAGFDVASEQGRRRVLAQAADSGQVAATSLLQLVQKGADDKWLSGVLVFHPVYRHGVLPAAGAARRQALQGYMVAVLRAERLVDWIGSHATKADVVVLLRDVTDPGRPGVLYRRGAAAMATGLAWSSDFAALGRRLRLEVDATPAYLSAQRSWQPWVVLAAGLVFAGLLGVYLLTMTGRTARIERLVDERTEALRRALQSIEDSERRFQAFVNAAPVMMWMTDDTQQAQLYNDAWLAFAGRTLDRALTRDWRREDVHPDDAARCADLLAQGVALRDRVAQQFRLRDGHGAYRWVEEVAVPRFGLDGRFAGYIGCCLDITERKVQDDKLADALKEKETLLVEIHHRVKNNLQIIDSLLGLQSAQVTDPAALAILRDSQSRLKSMAIIHQTLYQSKDFARVDFASVVDKLVRGLFLSYGADPNRIALTLSLDPISIPINSAIPLGLLVNELVSNALKHAFPAERGGAIQVELVPTPNALMLTVSDDGVGLPDTLDIDNCPSLGLQLVQLLAEQLHGTLDIRRRQPTCFAIRLPLSLVEPPVA